MMKSAALRQGQDRGSYPYPTGVEFSIALDEPHLRAVLALWRAWADEDGVDTYDEQRMALGIAYRIQTGVWLPVVAWNGETPVGMVEAVIFEDPFTGRITGHGDHAYVLPGWRKTGVFEGLVEGAIFIGQVFNVTDQMLPVGTKTVFLKPLYERYGFREIARVMCRRVP